MGVDYSVFIGSYIKVEAKLSEFPDSDDWFDTFTWVDNEMLCKSEDDGFILLIPNNFSVGEVRLSYRQDLGEIDFSQQTVENEFYSWLATSGFARKLSELFPCRWEVLSGIISYAH